VEKRQRKAGVTTMAWSQIQESLSKSVLPFTRSVHVFYKGSGPYHYPEPQKKRKPRGACDQQQLMCGANMALGPK
jgi:hypothetical protein